MKYDCMIRHKYVLQAELDNGDTELHVARPPYEVFDISLFIKTSTAALANMMVTTDFF
jgi:hypothetical protein